MNVVTLAYPLSESVLETCPLGGQVMAIGGFDGVHVGHQHVIGSARALAQHHDVPCAVMTFHPHPRELFGQRAYRSVLTPLPRKLENIAACGVETAYVVSFNDTFAQLSPENFVDHILRKMRVKGVVVGYNFSFGDGGRGTSDTLKQLLDHQADVRVVPRVSLGDESVSSTHIREALHAGDVSRAQRLLAKPYAIQGTVVRGDQRGRTLGFPTANMRPDAAYVAPATGVYAVTVRTLTNPSVLYFGVMNVGHRPTFQGTTLSWEVHLLDYDGDLYDQTLEISFFLRLREEKTFPSVVQLVQCIHQDISQARTFFAQFS